MSNSRLRVCAVSYLNTVPLVWGLVRGPQQDAFDLEFALPSVCADRLQSGKADVGLVPCAELDRLQLEYLPEVGIACRGPVRSILLISKCEPGQIRTLAADSSSRSSVMLSRIIVAERYGATPQVVSMKPELGAMLEAADAALIIGDPALAIEPESLPYRVLDLGAEWVEHTGLPMVFAVWAGPARRISAAAGQVFADSWRFGAAHMDEVIDYGSVQYGFDRDLVRKYLTEHIVFELGPRELAGLALFRSKVLQIQSREPANCGILVP